MIDQTAWRVLIAWLVLLAALGLMFVVFATPSLSVGL